MAFNADEKSRIKHFLSYPDWESLAQSIHLGFPSGSQPLFLVESAFNRLTAEGEVTVRRDLCECEDIESQMREARRRFKTTQLGKLHINRDEIRMLRQELTYWSLRLASDLGVVANPYAAFEYNNAAGGGFNARVV
jgi:hypothetical protein